MSFYILVDLRWKPSPIVKWIDLALFFSHGILFAWMFKRLVHTSVMSVGMGEGSK